MFKLDLRRLILLLTISTSLLTLAHTLYGSYQAERTLLLDQNLESNRAYAEKLAQSTNAFLVSLQHQIAYSANTIQHNLNNPEILQAEVDRLRDQDLSFNSIVVMGSDSRMIATAPTDLGLQGKLIRSKNAHKALELQYPMISEPYVAETGQLIFFISHPLYDSFGTYLGFLGGAIYLKSMNSLNTLLGEHFYHDGSEIYVLDENLRIIYHRDLNRIGESMGSNAPIVKSTLAYSGTVQLTTLQNENVLIGFASTEQSNWKIIVQRPTAMALMRLNTLLKKVVLSAIPFFLLLVIALWYLTKLISTPLHQLAKAARDWDNDDIAKRIQQTRSWYFEAAQIKKGMLISLGLVNKKLDVLDRERLTDPLTGLLNRRGLRQTINTWMNEGCDFVAIVCDIDRFKQVNDRYGHQAGDSVLVFIASRLLALSRLHDEVYRTGGEEFLLILPSTSLEDGIRIAERLRADIASTASPTGQVVTLSLGVAHWSRSQLSFEAVLEAADKALYLAKEQGGNRVEVIHN